jgi:hypothetical protein
MKQNETKHVLQFEKPIFFPAVFWVGLLALHLKDDL